MNKPKKIILNPEDVQEVEPEVKSEQLSLTELIQEIRKIIGKDYSDIKLEIWSDNSINFEIYENEVCIEIQNSKKPCTQPYINLEYGKRTGITYDEMCELTQIMKLIKDNMQPILDCVK